ncbi:arsenical pump-driving ATPase [Vogesella oryzae]|uniref:arsenical pump-driving ATPase n=1 Tax=Vogesella oryzae TaxID=1735285 RepID=UPI001583AE93|nr:arsenical pump-driving ATPase [Vogesella oryzae]
MHFLHALPAYVFFTGKGGVGKTSLACATAVKLADSGQRVLLVSTDPASNIGQVFGQTIGNHIVAIDTVPGLAALEIDPQAAAQDYRDRIVGPARGVLPEAEVRSMEEQLSGACTTEIAAFDEFTALLTDASLLHDYDHIVFDTAPTGHTIRLLQLPGAWSGFLDSGQGDASCLGPLAGLDKQRSRYHAAVAALTDPARTRLVLVARAQQATLREVARTRQELAALGMRQPQLVINGVLPQAACDGDPLAEAVWRREQAALAAMPAELASLPQDSVPLLPVNLVGVDALRQLLAASPAGGTAAAANLELPPLPQLGGLVDELAANGHGLIMLMGKGGVGKTTMAAAIAVQLAARGHAVHLTTSDPAGQLDASLQGSLPTLAISRIDPQAATEQYRAQVMASKGKQLDEQGRAMLAEDLRSPCTEEIAVFQAFSRVIRESGRKFVVLDTAPTGHTLLLLDATGAYHREVVRQMGERLHFTTPMMQLQDPAQTRALIVTLAETTPVLEAAGLQDDLRRAGIEPWGWIINNCLAQARPTAPLLRQRAASELPLIARVQQQYSQHLAVVPLQQQEPTGVAALLALGQPATAP